MLLKGLEALLEGIEEDAEGLHIGLLMAEDLLGQLADQGLYTRVDVIDPLVDRGGYIR